MEDTKLSATTQSSQPENKKATTEIKQPNPIISQALSNMMNSIRENTAALVGLGVITRRLEDKIDLLFKKGA